MIESVINKIECKNQASSSKNVELFAFFLSKA